MAAIRSPRSLSRLVGALALAVVVAGVVSAQADPAEPSPAPASSEPFATPLLAPAIESPEGTWRAVAFDAWGGGLVEPRPRSRLTVSLLPAGRLEGETACGTYLGGYSLEGERLQMRVMSKGPDPCTGKRLEEAVDFTLALGTVATWAPTPTGLELLDESGGVRVVLERPGVSPLMGDWDIGSFMRKNGKLRVPLDEAPVTIGFGADGGVTGSTGCRLFEGRYDSEVDRVVIAAIDLVGLPCEGTVRRQERQLLGALGRVALWERTDAGLTLTDGRGVTLLELTPSVEVMTPESTEPAASPAPPSPGPAGSALPLMTVEPEA